MPASVHFAARGGSVPPSTIRSRGTQTAGDDASAGEDVATSTTSSFESVLSQYCSQPDDAGSQKSGFHTVLRPQYSALPDDKSDSSESDSQPKQNSPDPAATVTVPVHMIEKAREILPLVLSIPTPADGTTHPELQTIAAVVSTAAGPPKDLDQAPEPEPTPTPAPRIEAAASTTPTAPSGEIAFAARITPDENAQAAPTTSAVQDPAAPKARVQAAPSQTAGANAAQPPAAAANEKAAEPVAKVEAPISPTPQSGQNHSAPPTKSEVPAASPSAAERMEQVIEPPPVAASGSGRDITVRVPDATDRGMDVRFVERGGEIHVSVRTGDNELAQTLRGGLNDFVSKLEHSGMHTEVWQPGSDAQNSQNDPRQQQWDSRGDQQGFGSGRNQTGSQDRQDGQREAKKPRWLEEMETVRQTSKEVS